MSAENISDELTVIPDDSINKPKRILPEKKKILAGVLVAIVVGIVLKKLQDQKKPTEELYVQALARSQIEPQVQELSDSGVDTALDGSDMV